MGLTVKTKGNFSRLAKKLKKINNEFTTAQFLDDTAKLLNSSIQERVQKKGEGTDGSKMKAYPTNYANARKKKGRQILFRDLTMSGKMFQSLTTSKGRNKAKMFFGNTESVNKASGNDARTPFFGLGAKEKEILGRELNTLIKDL